MPKSMAIVPGGQTLVAQVDEQLMAVVDRASEQVAQPVGVDARSLI